MAHPSESFCGGVPHPHMPPRRAFGMSWAWAFIILSFLSRFGCITTNNLVFKASLCFCGDVHLETGDSSLFERLIGKSCGGDTQGTLL